MNKGHLSIQVEVLDNAFRIFAGILQRGFYLKTRSIGDSLYSLLRFELGLSDKYIKNRIKIIFLDGKPSDDLESSLLQDGSRVALSSAMPGLAGAILRQNSPLTSMRKDITYKGSPLSIHNEGFIFLKLFNLIIDDIGKSILNRGIFLDKSAIIELLKDIGDSENSIIFRINGEKKSKKEFLRTIEDALENYFNLSVVFKKINNTSIKK